MEKRYSCKYCEAKTKNSGEVCSSCLEKLRLIRQIKAMLEPYKKSKEERENKDD